jgi:hypothetical protein
MFDPENTINLILHYQQYEKGKVITCRRYPIAYRFKYLSQRLTFLVDDRVMRTIELKGEALQDLGSGIQQYLPEEFPFLTPLSMIEDYLLDGFLKGEPRFSLNHSLCLIPSDPTLMISLIKSDGQTLFFPVIETDYFDLTMEKLLGSCYQ